MNYTNFKILNINFTYILDYMTTLFSDIRLDIDILLTIFLIINTLLAFSIVFLEYQTTRSSWAWILVLFLIPYLGFILYLMLGRPIYREKIFPFSDEEKISYQESLLKQATPYEISKEEQIIYKYRNLIELNYETDKAFLSKKNKIKIITDGKEKFELLFEDIKKAKAVIIAADKAVEMNRFDGKPLINRPVADGIRKTEELINLALSGDAEIYRAANGAKAATASNEKQSLGGAFYKHLMSGVSQMLPFVIGGGIMIALAFLIDGALGVPQDSLGNLGSYHELASMFMKIGGAAFGLMLPVFAGYVAYSIAEKPGLVAGFVAGAIAKEGFAFGKIPYAAGGEATSTLAGVSSGFLGALVGGFIAGALVLAIKKYVKVPRSLEGAKSILLLPLLGTILTGFVMLAVNIPMAAINTAMNDFLGGLGGGSAVLLGIVLGGMMAVDMGGPVNKAAYVFGTGTLAATVSSGGSVAMAAVMAGGMVPPLAIFVATLLFKDKFTKEERNSGLTNIIMGLSFITEGAIPFGAADPARAIPSFILGSAVAGGLVGLTGIKLMAPHGGIFVIALTSNALLYLASVLVGAIVSGVVYGYLRKPLEK